MSTPPAPEDIWKNAGWLVQALDPGAGLVRVVEMTADDYRQASFLDDRLFQQARKHNILTWDAVASARPPAARANARWIFHIGHVGSTLISRLLGELDGVLSVREPRILRDITFVPVERRGAYSATVQLLMSRTFGPAERSLVKATSFVSEIAHELVPPAERALFMFAQPRAYIESILAGENSRKEMALLAQTRSARMAQRVGSLENAMRDEAHLAAAAWACEMTALEAAAEAMTDRQLEWADFDRMLEDMEGGLAAVASFFGFDATAERIRTLARGPLMSRYSKALEHEYSPALRHELLQQAGREHGSEINSALAMLERAAENAPLLARALKRARRDI